MPLPEESMPEQQESATADDFLAETDKPVITELQLDENAGTLPLTSKKLLEKAKKALMSRFESVQEQHDEFVKKCNEWDSMYRGLNPKQLKETLSKICSKITFNSVEDWVATMIDSHFSVTPPIDVKSQRGKDSAETMQRIRKVLWQNAEVTNIEENAETIFRNGVKYGTFTAKAPYAFQEEMGFKITKKPKEFNILGMKFSTPLLQESSIQEEIRIEDRVPLLPVDIRNLYFRYDKKTWVIELVASSWDVIEAQKEMYANLEEARKAGLPDNNPTDEQKKAVDANPNKSAAELDRDLELLEGHHVPILFDEEDGIPELVGKKILCTIVAANRANIIRIKQESLKKPPYFIVPFIPVDGSELGIGIPQIIDPLVSEFNTRRNQSLDANTLGLYAQTVANMRYIKKPEQLKRRPMGVVELKNVPVGVRAEDVIAYDRPPVEFVQIATNLIDRINAEIITSTRLKGVMSGEKITPNPSATEMTSIMKEAFKSIKMIFRRIDRNLFEPYYEIAYFYFVLYRQKSWTIATSEMQINPDTGAPMMKPIWEEISPEQIYSDGIAIKILGTTHMEDEIVMRHQNMQLLDLSSKYVGLPIFNELGKPVIPNFYNLMNDVYLTFNKPDISRMWTQPPPPPPPPEAIGADGQVMQGGPGNIGLGTPAPTPANIVGGATNPRAIRQPVRGIK